MARPYAGGGSIDKPKAPVSSPAQPVLLPYAVLRAAAWPIEVTDAFAAPALARLAESILEAERAVVERRDAIVATLHAAIPRAADGPARAYLLAVKRRVHNTTEPLPSVAPVVLQPEIAAVLEQEAAHRRALGQERSRFERLHDAAVDDQLAALRRLTLQPRFQRALLVANPSVARAWLEPAAVRRPKRQRHLETTIFHYVMRACGRATPNGAWSGVAPVLPRDDPNGSLSATATAARYTAAVSLQPFVLMLRALARQPRYRWAQPLHLNPTLRPDPAGGWRYEQDQAGVHRWVSLPFQPLLNALMDAYADGQQRLAAPLVEALATLWPGEPSVRPTLERLVNWLVDRDVLRCAPPLPLSAPDAWTALAAMMESLDESDRSSWGQAIDRLRWLCVRLAHEFDELPPEQVEGCLTAIEAEIQQLWHAAGLDGSPPPPLVHLDMRLGFEVTWTKSAIDAAARTVRALLSFHASDGGAEIFRRQSLRDVFASSDGVTSVIGVLDRLDWQVPPRPRPDGFAEGGPEFGDTLEFILGQMPPESSLGREAQAYCRGWQLLLESVRFQRVHQLAARLPQARVLPGPGGAVLLRLAAADDLWIGPARPEPALFASRFAALLDPLLLDALRDSYATAAKAGVTPAEIVGWDAFNPNGALHPVLTPRTLDPHDLRDVCLLADPVAQRVWLHEPAAESLLAPVYSTGADIGSHDVCSRLLLVAAASHGWEFPSFQTPPLRAERSRWKHLPRLLLSDGPVLRPERWTIDRATIERINAAKGAARFLAWRGELRRMGAPDLVHVRCGPYEPELLMRTDSPLAVRCLFDTHAARAPWIELSELPGSPEHWPLHDADGQHYLAELAVSWVAEEYWQAVVPTRPG